MHRAIALAIIAHLVLAACCPCAGAAIVIELDAAGKGSFAVRLDTTADVARTPNDIIPARSIFYRVDANGISALDAPKASVRRALARAS